MSRLLRFVLIVGILAVVALWWFARPNPIPEARLAGLTGEVRRGEMVFWATGCARATWLTAPRAKTSWY
jgi:hypothetical protein